MSKVTKSTATSSTASASVNTSAVVNAPNVKIETSPNKGLTPEQAFVCLHHLHVGDLDNKNREFEISRFMHINFMGANNLRAAKAFQAFCTGKPSTKKITIMSIQDAYKAKALELEVAPVGVVPHSHTTMDPAEIPAPVRKTTVVKNAKAAAAVAKAVQLMAAAKTTEVTTKIVKTEKAPAKAIEKAPAKATEKAPAKAPAKATEKAAAKAAAKAPAKVSTYGTAVNLMCAAPDCTFDQLVAEVTKVDATLTNLSALRTAYATVRTIVKQLKANGKM